MPSLARPLPSLALLVLQAGWSVQQCCLSRQVAGDGPKSGLYSLQSSAEASCQDGCLYQKQGSSSTFCFTTSYSYLTSCNSTTPSTTASAPASASVSAAASSPSTIDNITNTLGPSITTLSQPQLTTAATTSNPTTPTTLTTTITESLLAIWRMNRTLFSPPTITQHGTWGEDEFCQEGAYAVGLQLYVASLCDRRCKNDDDQALMGVRLQCASYPHTAASAAVTHEVTSLVAGPCNRRATLPCTWQPAQACNSPDFLTESRYLSEYFHDSTETEAGQSIVETCPEGLVCRNITTSSSDPVGGMNVDMRCSDGSVLSGNGVFQAGLALVDGMQTSSWSTWTTCPPNYAICGIRSKVHQGEADKQSNLGQTEVLFHCCQLPGSFAG